MKRLSCVARLAGFFLFSLFPSLLVGCASSLAPVDTMSPTRMQIQSDTSQGGPTAEYVLQVGDELDIKFFYNPELNERVVIRPDGKISFGLISELHAAGMTPEKLREIISIEYGRLYKDVKVAVIVREFAGQLVYLGGEVLSPKVLPLKGRMTALQAINAAGGVKETAKLSDVVLIRNSGRSKPIVAKVDLEKVLKEGKGDVPLLPYDIVYVPKTFIAKADLFVDQYINQIIPRAVSVVFPFNMYIGTLHTKNVNDSGAVGGNTTPSSSDTR